MKKISLLVSLICLFTVSSLLAQNQKADILETGIEYLVYTPEDYLSDSDKSWPLLIFLHGAGERGNKLDLVKFHGPPKLAEEGEDFPFIIISPQVPERSWWKPALVQLLVEKIVAEYNVDIKRIYLTGLSMGGFGTWDTAMRFPELFAAIAPICGGGDTTMIANLKNVPVWNFHGAKDDVVPLERSEVMVNALKRAGGKVIFTVYPDANHDSWTETYNNPELYKWFLSHSK
ncbi:MAG: prolyl oligopeptidase family serine peptidase [Marinilabiliaceae bacterium]|jgi:predicted peptidase|nr:prolyl oligopeptidase family serine peptidase [Marinilabiliaceae bacterium]